jgi:hypothetical protein
MRGHKQKQVEIAGLFNVEDRIDPKHPIREVKRQCDAALGATPWLSRQKAWETPKRRRQTKRQLPKKVEMRSAASSQRKRVRFSAAC